MPNDIVSPDNITDLMLDVRLAFDTIIKKAPRYTTQLNYYRGLQPLRYSAERLRKAFDQINVYFSQNWISVVCDAVLDRLILKGVDISSNEAASQKANDLWDLYNLMLVAEDVHQAFEVVGEAYVIAMESDDTETPYDIYYNDPRMCHMFYDYDQPNKKRFAAKLFIGGDHKLKITLYYPDKFFYFTSNNKIETNAAETWVATAQSFFPDPELPYEDNPYGKIPVFHFRDSGAIRKHDLGPSEISLQDAINKLLTDMMVSAEFNTFVQRVVIAQSDPGELLNSPNMNWWIPAGDSKGQATSVSELGGRALTPFLDAIDKLATSLAIISRTPKHYFFSQSGSPSGEALIAMEAPLNKKTTKKKLRANVTWIEFFGFLLNDLGQMNIDKKLIQPTWEPVETVQPKTSADIIKTETDAGIPLVTAVKRQGWTDAEVKQMNKDKEDEKKSTSGLAQNALDQLRAADQQNNNAGNLPMNNQNMQQMMNGKGQNMMNNSQGTNTQASSGNQS